MEKNGLVIADSGVIFSLAVLDKLEILEELFDEIKIPIAVWNEITLDETVIYYNWRLKKSVFVNKPTKNYEKLYRI